MDKGPSLLSVFIPDGTNHWILLFFCRSSIVVFYVITFNFATKLFFDISLVLSNRIIPNDFIPYYF